MRDGASSNGVSTQFSSDGANNSPVRKRQRREADAGGKMRFDRMTDQAAVSANRYLISLIFQALQELQLIGCRRLHAAGAAQNR